MPSRPNLKPTTADAYALLQQGAITLAHVESVGMRVDVPYLDSAIEETTRRIDDLTREVHSDPVMSRWKKRFGLKTNSDSVSQLGEVLFEDMSLPYDELRFGLTEKGHKKKASKEVVLATDLPFCKKYIERKELLNARTRYLYGLKRETVRGLFHPTFNLHQASTFRSTSGRDKNEDRVARDFNIQNIPTRNSQMAEIIRKCFIPRKGRRIIEVDFSQLEVRVAACRTLDPTLIAYIKDTSTCMHRDTAARLFFFEPDYLVKHKDWAKKTVRDWAKNRWVFPQFYGSCYFQCAPHIWEACSDEKYTLPDTGETLLAHLKRNGVKELGLCDPKERPRPGTFEYHCKKIEDWMWKEQYPVYSQWKKDTYEDYCRTGKIHTLTGFTLEGLFRRNVVLNTDIQGSSFHLLLWAMTEIEPLLKKYRMKSQMIFEIHDCLGGDVPDNETQDFIDICHDVMTRKTAKHFRWLTVPLAVEPEVTPLGGSWLDKKQWVYEEEQWQPVRK